MPPAPPAPRGSTTLPGWHDDFNRAYASARACNRPLLVLFTGSDWCPHCIRLHQGALSDPEFARIARDYLILVYCDMPSRIKLPADLRQQNQYLSRVLRAGEGVPCTILLAPNGTEIGRIEGNPSDYLHQLHELLKRNGIRVH